MLSHDGWSGDTATGQKHPHPDNKIAKNTFHQLKPFFMINTTVLFALLQVIIYLVFDFLFFNYCVRNRKGIIQYFLKNHRNPSAKTPLLP